MPNDATFGARLALIRQAMGWGNMAEAAVACGLPVASWRNWEQAERQPRDYFRIVQTIAARTGCDAVWLAGLDMPGGPTVAGDARPPAQPPAAPARPRERPEASAEHPGRVPAAARVARVRRGQRGDTPHPPAGMRVSTNNDTYPATIDENTPDRVAA